MSKQQIVFLVGGTGRTGGRVMRELLRRGVEVRAVVRSLGKVPPDITDDPKLELIEADLLSVGEDRLQGYARGCDAVVSCLGHVISAKGIWGEPRDLVTQAITRICRAIESLRPASPVKVVLMGSVSVNHPGGIDTHRGAFEKASLAVIRGAIPPAKDNQTAATFLYEAIGTKNAFVEWTVVRPDALEEGDASAYSIHEGLVSTIFRPDATRMANVAHFMADLVTKPEVWNEWKGRMPVIINEPAKA